MAAMSLIQSAPVTILLASVLLLGIFVHLRPPIQLRHIPQVPVGQLLYSYASGEVEEQRIKRIILPFAQQHNTDVVLVWLFGEWQVHLLDAKIGKDFLENRQLRKQQPPQRMLFWQLLGRENIFFTEGDQWRKHSRIFKAAMQRTMPIEHFIATSRRLLALLGDGGKVNWSDLTHRFTLDVVGATVLGYDFAALDHPHGSFVAQYHEVMTAISDPLYIFLPMLEWLIPRHEVRRKIDNLLEKFGQLLAKKQKDPGNDVITYMWEEPDMTETEMRDSVVVTFIAGHDTTAGALSGIVHYLGMHPQHQERARKEVLSVIGSKEEPTIAHFGRTPFLTAVIRESIRMNGPTNIAIPRFADTPLELGPYTVPPNTPIVLNMCGIMGNPRKWDEPGHFNPDRFMGDEQESNEGQWVPFAFGPHQCPAKNFSLYEQRTLTAMLLREYAWEVPQDSIHRDRVKNAFSPFSLSLPYDVDIVFRRI